MTATLELEPGLDEYAGRDWDDEHDACAADPGFLCDQYGIIDKPKRPGAGEEPEADELGGAGGGGGTVPFRLWPAQVGLMGTLATERLTLILKARQLGISWLVCAYVLWVALFHPHQVIFLYSKGQSEANELLRRIKSLFERLPGPLRDRLPRIEGKDNTRELGFSNGSLIRSMPATKSAGISFTASLVVLDEWAHQLWGGVLYEMVKPIMEAGGQLIILSTANGVGNWFHEVWQKAVKGQNSFRAVFLPWWARPGRDVAWYQGVVRDANDPDRVKENYPANPIEAFRSSGRTRFHPDWVEAQAKNLRDPPPAHHRDFPASLRGVPGLRVYSPPRFGRRYLVAADVGEGKETSNYDAAVVLDADSLEEVAFLHGQWEPDIYALWLIALGQCYRGPDDRDAVVIPERNNHGHAVLATLKLKGYRRVGLGHDGYPGWLTGTKTKPEGIDRLAECLRDALITVRSQAALHEFSVYKRLKGGSTGAEAPNFDDIVMAWYVAVSWLRHEAARKTGRTAEAVANPLAGYRG